MPERALDDSTFSFRSFQGFNRQACEKQVSWATGVFRREAAGILPSAATRDPAVAVQVVVAVHTVRIAETEATRLPANLADAVVAMTLDCLHAFLPDYSVACLAGDLRFAFAAFR